MLHISPKKDNVKWDCFEGCFISIIFWLKRDYRWMDFDSLQFRFDETRIGTVEFIPSLIQYNWRSKFELLDKYVGLKVIPHRTNDPFERIALLKAEARQNKPVMTVMDAFWCPWDKSYQVFSRPHFFLITGMDEEEGIFYCTDSFYEKEHEVLTFEQYLLGALPRELPSVHTFEILESVQLETSPRELIEQSIREVISLNTFEQIRSFARAVAQHFDVDREMRQFDNIDAAPIIRSVYERKRFINRYVDCIKAFIPEGSDPVIDQKLEELIQLGDQWEIVKSMFVKSSKKKNLTLQLQLITNRLLEMADREEEIVKSFLEHLTQENVIN